MRSPTTFLFLCPLLALHFLSSEGWLLPVSRLPPIPVPSLPDLKAKITQIRNFQYMMDKMDYEDDVRIPIAIQVPVLQATRATSPPVIPSSNASVTQLLASPAIDMMAGMPPIPSRAPQSEFVNRFVIIDIPKTIAQSVRSFYNWLDRMLDG